MERSRVMLSDDGWPSYRDLTKVRLVPSAMMGIDDCWMTDEALVPDSLTGVRNF